MLHTVQIGLFELAGSPSWVELNFQFYLQDDIAIDWVVDRMLDQLVISDDGWELASIEVQYTSYSRSLPGQQVCPNESRHAIHEWLESTPGIRFLS